MAAPAVAHAAPPPFEQQKEVVANFTDTAGRPGVLGPGYLDGRSGLRLGEDHAQARDHQLSWAAIAATAALVRRSRSGRVRAVAGLVAVLVAGVVLAGTGGDKRVELVAADGRAATVLRGRRRVPVGGPYVPARRVRPDRAADARGRAAALTVRGWSEAGLARSADRAELTILSNEPDAEQIAAGLANGITARLALDPDDAAARQAERWLAARALDEPARSQYVATFAPALGAVLATTEPEQWRWFLDVVERQP